MRCNLHTYNKLLKANFEVWSRKRKQNSELFSLYSFNFFYVSDKSKKLKKRKKGRIVRKSDFYRKHKIFLVAGFKYLKVSMKYLNADFKVPTHKPSLSWKLIYFTVKIIIITGYIISIVLFWLFNLNGSLNSSF